MNERSIFQQALDITESVARRRFLDDACQGDADLRQRVDALLQAHQVASGFLEQPPLDVTGAYAPPPSLTLGTIFAGRYKLREKLGEGGMGTVYVADQFEPVQRRVALKILKTGLHSPSAFARFEQERQALALMDHPNIAKVFDAGTVSEPRTSVSGPPQPLTDVRGSDGHPFFVMELVKGIPITKFCDQEHLSPRERLELFIPVCQAVQHAHQKGIIHRDLKPSNILIALYDGKPVPKVIDFGVAKATGQRLSEDTIYTEAGSIVGTLEYMAPEQAELNNLDIDTRADIYSLGVLLYELLTGSPPFSSKQLRSAGFMELLRLIKEVEPPKPSTRLSELSRSRLPGGTCTAGDQTPSGPARQAGPTVAAVRRMDPKKLIALVTGELDWIVMKALEKDRARRYETANGFAMDIQRYLHDEPASLASPPSTSYRLRKFLRRNKGPAVAAGLVAMALFGGIIGTSWGLVRAEQSRRRESERAEGERVAKETAETREAETRAVLEFVENKVFAAARPKDQEGGMGKDVQLRQAIEGALPFIDKSFVKQPLIEARLRMTLGASFWYLGEPKIAAEQYQAARTIYTKHLGHNHLDTLTSTSGLAMSYAGLGRDADAVKLFEVTLVTRKAKLGPDHPDTLRSMGNLASGYAGLGRHTEARALHEEALVVLKAKLGPDHPDTLLTMHNLADSYFALGRHADALNLREETLALMKGKLGSDHPYTLSVMDDLAQSYFDLGRHAGALKLFEETLALRQANLGPDHPHTLASMHNLAKSFHDLGRHVDALKLFEETLALIKAKFGPDHPDTLLSMLGMAACYAALGRRGDALRLDEQTLALTKAKFGPDHPHTLASMHSLAIGYAENARHSDALKLREDTLALRKVKLGPDHPDTLLSTWCLVDSLVKLDRGVEAMPLVDDCLKRAVGKAVDPQLIPTLIDLRLRHFANAKDPDRCQETTEMWEKLNRTDVDSLHNAARMRAVTTAVIKLDPKTPAADATRLAQEQADLAIAWLQKAIAAGYKGAAHLKADKDIDALRDRDDFKKLLAELETRKDK